MSKLDVPIEASLDSSSGSDGAIERDVPSLIFKGFELDDESRGAAGSPWGASNSAGDDELGSVLRGAGWLGSERSVRAGHASNRKLPRAGDEVLGFRLLRELGRGAFARVFLAEQIALANRRVAVKISLAQRDEAQTLAQLQHTHIVPIHSVHVDSTSGLRALVMPYFGGTTLDRLMDKAGLQPNRHVTGRSLVTALDALSLADFGGQPGGSLQSLPSQRWAASQASGLPSMGTSQTASPWQASRIFGRAFLGSWRDPAAPVKTLGQPAREILERSNYIHAVTWIAARLAEGLTHAHQRGILHRDIKPSNVLVASDGQPMLLDFNLARDLKSNDSGAVAYVGGTLPYMAPEHLDAFNVKNSTPPTAVDARSDIYSLGVVLFELLTNKNAFPLELPGDSMPALLDRMAAKRRERAPSPRAINPSVPQSLDAVVRRCLDPDPNRRYQEAAQLSQDLQCELDNLPLRHTPEPSLGERTRKWMRRHPRLSSGGSIAAISGVLIVGLAALVLLVGGRLAGYDAERRWIKFEEGLVRAQLLVHTGSEPGQNLTEGEQICRQTLAQFNVLADPKWRQKSPTTRLQPKNQARLPDDATELVVLLARVRAEQAKLAKPARDQNALLEDAIQLLDQAERFNPKRVPRSLYEDRGNYRRQLGDAAGADADAARAEATPTRSARDHYLQATSHAVEKRFADAARGLEAALRIDPKHFWARFELGICYYQLGQFKDAIGAYNACETLWSECPWVYLNRGLAYSRLDNWDDAITDYTKAISQDGNFSDAYVNRGLAHLNRRRHAEAIADLDRAIELGQKRGTVWAARATAFAARGELDQARADFDAALRASPGEESILSSRGFALARLAPDLALADFDRILERRPQSAQAHYGRAYVLGEMPDRGHEAIDAARRALAADENHLNARCALAVLLARAGEYESAITTTDDLLRRNRRGQACYTAACVYALAARQNTEHAHQAFHWLEKSLEQKFPSDSLRSDKDLDPIRSDARFADIVARIGFDSAKP